MYITLKYLKTLFGQVSARMTEFIALKLGIDKIKAKEIQSDYFYKHTSLNGLLINHPGKSMLMSFEICSYNKVRLP